MKQGDFLRDQALDRVETANKSWVDTAVTVGRAVASTMAEFTSDDIWNALDEANRPREPRAMGPVMMRLQRAGVIRPTDRVKKSALPQCHSRPKRVWRSML